MADEKYVLNCPHCGLVEGFIVASQDQQESPPEAETIIQQQVVRTPAGTRWRVRCPRCGRWLPCDRARPV